MTREYSLVDKALSIAKKAHKGQLDKAGKDYILHPIHVSQQVKLEEEKAVALLHDVIEDTEITLEDLKKAGMPMDVVEAVNALTKVEGIDYFDYLKKVKENSLARVVKLADLKHNSDLSRIPEPSKKDLERNIKYKRAMEYLNSVEE